MDIKSGLFSQTRREQAQSLTQVWCGQKGIIVGINGDARFLGRITAIGLTVGCQFEVLQNEKHMPVLLYARDTIIALSRREGEKIMAEVKV
jgi:ferrous iron transport protein A